MGAYKGYKVLIMWQVTRIFIKRINRLCSCFIAILYGLYNLYKLPLCPTPFRH